MSEEVFSSPIHGSFLVRPAFSWPEKYTETAEFSGLSPFRGTKFRGKVAERVGFEPAVRIGLGRCDSVAILGPACLCAEFGSTAISGVRVISRP